MLTVREPYSGAWQRNDEVQVDSVLTFGAVFRCVSLIASDIAKLRLMLVSVDEQGIWSETTNPAYSPVLRKPNHFQTRGQFVRNWVESKLIHGNTYVLKERDGRGVVTAMYVLDPSRVKPLVAPNGDVYYRLTRDDLASVADGVTVPASEIIHDRWNTVHHPLIGMSPIYACGMSAMQGINIQTSAGKFWRNGAQPSGIITAPGTIPDDTAKRIKDHWESEYSGVNAGRTAVLGDGLKYEQMSVNADDAQLIQQLQWSASDVALAFGVPLRKLGLGSTPASSNVQAQNVEYYTDCLQILIEDLEATLDDGLAVGEKLGTYFDIDGLLRMDSLAQYEVLEKAKSVLTLDERRRKVDARALPVGGNTVYLQQQDHSIEAIAARDKQLIEQAEHPPAAVVPAPAPAADSPPANDNADQLQAMAALVELHKGFR